jgi:hypothetical protein
MAGKDCLVFTVKNGAFYHLKGDSWELVARRDVDVNLTLIQYTDEGWHYSVLPEPAFKDEPQSN